MTCAFRQKGCLDSIRERDAAARCAAESTLSRFNNSQTSKISVLLCLRKSGGGGTMM
jgi:hypothetical protein